MLFTLSHDLNSNLALTLYSLFTAFYFLAKDFVTCRCPLGYLNPALNNSALFIRF